MSQPDDNQQERYSQNDHGHRQDQHQHSRTEDRTNLTPSASDEAIITEAPFAPLITTPPQLSLSLVNAASPTGSLVQDITDGTDSPPTILLANKQKANRSHTVLVATGSCLTLMIVLIASILFISRGKQAHSPQTSQATTINGGQSTGGIPITSAATATSIAATSSAGSTVSTPGATSIAGSGPPIHPTPTQAPSNSTITLFGFEDGTSQGWGHNGTQITGIVSNTTHVYSGTHALEIKFTGLTPTTYPYASGPVQQSATPGSALIAFIYVPSGLSIKGQLFVQQGSVFYTQTTNGYLPLTSGTWNKLEFAMPANLDGKTIIQVGFQFLAASGTQNGSLWIDAVRWQT